MYYAPDWSGDVDVVDDDNDDNDDDGDDDDDGGNDGRVNVCSREREVRCNEAT